MKRTRAQNPKLQDQEPQDPAAAAGNNPNPKPQRRAKQPRQPKAATAGKKTAAARETAAAATATAANAAAASASPVAEMASVVPDVCVSAGGVEVACGLPADWDEMDGANGSPWWTFGVEEEKLLGWFPFVEEDFRSIGGVGPAAEAAAVFDDDIWRIHQIYEIPGYAAK